MELQDFMYELSHALDQYRESERHSFDMSDFDAFSGNGDVSVTDANGVLVGTFAIRVREAN